MKLWHRTAAGIVGLTPLLAFALEPQVDGIRSYSTPQYTLVTHDADVVRKLPLAFTKIDTALRTLLKAGPPRPDLPVYIFVMRGSTWNEYLRPGQMIVSEYVPGRFAGYVLLDNQGKDMPSLRHALNHEYAHHFLRSRVPGYLPLWYHEGFAEVIEGADFYMDSVTFADIPSMGVGVRRLPIERVLSREADSSYYRDDTYSHSFQAQSWALVHRALLADKDFGTKVSAYLAAVKSGNSVDRALQAGFDMNAAQLDEDMHRYMNRHRYEGVRLALKFPPVAELGTGTPMSRLDSLEFLADIMLASGFRPERLPEVIASARRHEPDSPQTKVLAMRLAARDGDDAELQRLLSAIESSTTELRIARGAGLALLERVREPTRTIDDGLRARFEARAFELLSRVATETPGDVEAVWGHALLAGRLGREVQPALSRVRQTMLTLPTNADLSMAAALLCKAIGERDAMLSYLNDTVRFATLPAQRDWALAQLEQLEGD
jgi:hypothetical protein